MRRWPCWPGPYSRRFTGLFGRPQMFSPIRRSILYFASMRLVIASSWFDWLVRKRALLCPGEAPEPTGRVPKRQASTTGRETPRGLNLARRAVSRGKRPEVSNRGGGRGLGRIEPETVKCGSKFGGRLAARGEDRAGLRRRQVLRSSGRPDRPRGARSRAPDRSSAPARAPAARSGRAAADSACRRARSCRCALRRPATKHGAISARIVVVGRPARPQSAASASAASRAEPTRVRSQPWPKLRIRAWVYSRATVASVPSTETRFDCDAAQAGLIAGTVPTNGTLKALAQRRQRLRRGGVAGDHDEIGRMRRDQVAHQRDRRARRAHPPAPCRRETAHRPPRR